MNKRIVKKLGGWLLLLIVTLSTIQTDALTAKAATPSKREYGVSISDARSIYLHNNKPIDGEIGTEFYMTYTVEKLTGGGSQMGIAGTADPNRTAPYTEGGFMRYQKEHLYLLQEGATYFIKCTVAKGGFRYDITRAKGDELTDLYFEFYTGGAVKDTMNYFGLYGARLATTEDVYGVELSHVRCYDAKGNDLGIKAQCKNGGFAVVSGTDPLQRDTKLNTWYEIVVEDQKHVAVSNKLPTDSKKIYFEYTVEEAKFFLHQEGVAMSNKPKDEWPHGTGCLKYIQYVERTETPKMLEPGASYLVIIECAEDDFSVTVEKKKGSSVEQFSPGRLSKTYNSSFKFASLWFSEVNPKDLGSFKLTNVKIYDENHKSLGIQCNKSAAITRKGAPESYKDCEAVYYCKENQKSFGLYKDKTFKFTDSQGTTEGTYKVSSDVMTMTFNDGSSAKYDYLYEKITDSSDNVYVRLKNYKLRFVTGSDTKIETQKFSTKNGYIAKQPENPVLEGCEFEGWYKKDGTEYDFNQLVTESNTLYAKWSGDGGITFIADGVEADTGMTSTYIFVGGGVLLVAIALAVCILLIRKGAKARNDRK